MILWKYSFSEDNLQFYLDENIYGKINILSHVSRAARNN